MRENLLGNFTEGFYILNIIAKNSNQYSHYSDGHEGLNSLKREKGNMISPEYKFHTYVTTVTILIMYVLIGKVATTLDENHWVLGVLLSALSAFGLYNVVATAVRSFARNVSFFKKHLLGSRYLNGTWVGSFQGSNGEDILTVEYFEQDISHLNIRGHAIKTDGNVYATWNSIATSINEKNGQLTYTYICDPHEGQGEYRGVGVFVFERRAFHLPPEFINGYSADLTDGEKGRNREKRTCDKLLDLNEAIDRAKKFSQEGV